MLEKLFYFGLGYITARWLILHYGQDAYLEKEKELIGIGKEKIDDLLSEPEELEPYQEVY
jgi:hypothetical protein